MSWELEQILGSLGTAHFPDGKNKRDGTLGRTQVCARCHGQWEEPLADVHIWSEAGLENHAAGPLPTGLCLLG